jgi:hypothetical protein
MHNTHSSYSKDSMEAMKYTIMPGRAKSDTKKWQIAREAHDGSVRSRRQNLRNRSLPSQLQSLVSYWRYIQSPELNEESGEEFVIDEEGLSGNDSDNV